MLRKTGVLIAFATVMLQLAVMLQPFIPEQNQVAPVCEKISAIVITQSTALKNPVNANLNDVSHQDQVAQFATESVARHTPQLTLAQPHHEHAALLAQQQAHDHQPLEEHHTQQQCQYCVLYELLVMPPLYTIQLVLLRTQQRLLSFQQQLQHLYFELQHLYLMPQGRAPPYF